MRRYKRLANLLWQAFLPVVIVPLLIVGIVSQWQYDLNRRQVELNIENDLLHTCFARKAYLEALIQNAADSVGSAAAVWPTLASGAPAVDVLKRLAFHMHAFTRLWVVTPGGTVRYSSVDGDQGRAITGESAWKEFRTSRALTYSDLVTDPEGRRIIRILVPLPDGGAMVGSYDTVQLQQATWDPMAVRMQRFAYVIDGHGRAIARADTVFSEDVPPIDRLPPVKQALKGYSGRILYQDPRTHQERSAAYLQLPATGWAIVLTQPSARSMLVSLSTAHGENLLILVLGIALALLASLWLSRKLAAPVEYFSMRLEHLARSEIRSDHAGLFSDLGSDVTEFNRVAESAQALYSALAETILTLRARSNELSLANQETAATVENLRRLEKLRTDFMNALSHDLRIPVTAIIGNSELLEESEDPPLSPTECTYVSQILEACSSMQGMLEELLDYARLEVGRLKLHIVPVGLSSITDEVKALFCPLAEQKELGLDFQVPGELPPVTVDPDRLRQILINLVSNAIKYTPPGGHVWVRARTERAMVVLEVQDTGIGLSAEDRTHLFEKFFRSSRPEVQREKGSGIGLALVKGVVEAMGGWIDVESELGKGSLFRVILPVAGPEGSPPHA